MAPIEKRPKPIESSKKTKNAPLETKAAKVASELDDLFSTLASKKAAKKKAKASESDSLMTKPSKNDAKAASASSTDPAPKSKKSKSTETPSSWLDQALSDKPTQSRRYTPDGYVIYTEEELVSQTGGETKDCPFNCSCCY